VGNQPNRNNQSPENQQRKGAIKTMRKSLNLLVAALVVLAVAGSALAATPATATPTGVVNINTADAAQLALLPHVGAKAAQRVVDYRHEHGPFKKTADLMQVRGFGEKSFQRLTPYLTVDGKTTLSAKVRSPRKPRSAKASKPTTASR
jgi:competence protein ComEA